MKFEVFFKHPFLAMVLRVHSRRPLAILNHICSEDPQKASRKAENGKSDAFVTAAGIGFLAIPDTTVQTNSLTVLEGKITVKKEEGKANQALQPLLSVARNMSFRKTFLFN